MQTFSAVAVLLAVAVTAQSASVPAVKDKIAAIGKKCATESHLPQGDIKIAFNQDIPKNEAERCFLDCVYKNAGVTDGTKFNLEGSRKLVQARFPNADDAAMANQLVDTCNKEIKVDAGEKCSLGRVVRECFVKHGKSVNFFISAA